MSVQPQNTDPNAIPEGEPTGVIGSKLAGRVALVTGGTRGIGASIGHSLAAQGASIAAGYCGNLEKAQRFAADFRSTFGPGIAVSVHQGNVASGADCRRVVREVLEQHGRLDILVNNAGITIDKTILKLTDDDWHKVLDVNLSGPFFLSQAALAHMVERGTGRIINVSSIIGAVGNIGQANYAASKSGLFGLTKTFARGTAFLLARSGKLDDGSIGLTVNTVTPGYMSSRYFCLLISCVRC
jgi:NAD(P)-dependent dehydrogenase (short-subunit alcohol dehydrogenase family)